MVHDAAARYAALCRARVDTFVDRNYSLFGALELNRRALGWDLVRAPTNISLAGPELARRTLVAGARALKRHGIADRLDRRRLVLDTDVGREIEWRLFSELLGLPYRQAGRSVERDAFAEEILADARVEALADRAALGLAPEAQARIRHAVSSYAATRVAAADLSSGLASAGVGMLLFHKLTPGALTLGPVAAHALLQHAAVSAFPLGAALGSVWYGLFPTAAPLAFSVVMTGGVAAGLAAVSAFSGVVSDPVQRRLGLHRRRLLRLIDAVEAALRGDDARFVAHDHYVARVFDLIDALATVRTATRGG
ncbi:MAG: DUF6635 family protein [Alphaproteobacteria bacterium]